MTVANSKKYPSLAQCCVEVTGKELGGAQIPVEHSATIVEKGGPDGRSTERFVVSRGQNLARTIGPPPGGPSQPEDPDLQFGQLPLFIRGRMASSMFPSPSLLRSMPCRRTEITSMRFTWPSPLMS